MQAKPPLLFSFDVGHSSIGWAVLSYGKAADTMPDILGCGAVIFGADDCLASARRTFRRQRRHVRATRQRIKRLHNALLARKCLTEAELDTPGCWNPFQLAADNLDRKRQLSWAELWDVLRWYAHNRGYDGNRRWSLSADQDTEEQEDNEKLLAADGLMKQFNTQTMAATMLAFVTDYEKKAAKFYTKHEEARPTRFKGQNAAFRREIVEAECRRILQAHAGKLPGLDAKLIELIMDDAKATGGAEAPPVRRYQGGLLFGQMVPRFDNRIIATCPISQQKVPNREGKEFYRFRWAMMLANIRIATAAKADLRSLNLAEKAILNNLMLVQGKLTPGELKTAVKALEGRQRDNLEALLLHPDMGEALILDPVQNLIASEPISVIWPLLSEKTRKVTAGKWRAGRSYSLNDIVERQPLAMAALTEYLAVKAAKGKGSKKETLEVLLAKTFGYKLLGQRAAYARHILQAVSDQVLTTDIHPKEKSGVLFITDEMRQAQLHKPIDEQTNNHLVRHRLKILAGEPTAKPKPRQGLFHQLLQEYADGDRSRIARITVEVNRELRELSGKTNKEQATDMGQRLSNFKSVVGKLEKIYPPSAVRPGLIRKARILEDLGGKCPYTGKEIDLKDLSNPGYVDKDHVIPRSDRESDSLDSLVITFKAVNAIKGKRTAYRFVEEFQGQPVPGMENVYILPLSTYLDNVKKLESFKGHDDDIRRKRKRKSLMQLPDYEEKEFTPGDLTKTSQLVRLAVQALGREFEGVASKPVLTSMPGSVTGSARKSWNLLGCLATANPGVLDEGGLVRSKTEVRDITHLHHALDACVLACADHYLGRDGEMWRLLTKRNLSMAEQAILKAKTGGLFVTGLDGKGGSLQNLPDQLKEQIRLRLAERNVTQHLPRGISGLRLEQNAWRVVSVDGDTATLRQRTRDAEGKIVMKEAKEKTSKLLGFAPEGETQGKLKPRQSVLVIPENYGLALDPTPTIIPYHKVWNRLRELQKANGGKKPRVIRNGQIIEIASGNYAGRWKIFSVKNNSSGLALDMGRPDVVRLKNKTEGHKINVRLNTLLKDGLKIP